MLSGKRETSCCSWGILILLPACSICSDDTGKHSRSDNANGRCSQILSRLESHQNNLERERAARLARRELVFCQMLVRTLAPTGVCLIRSIAFCTYLRALGLPAKVVIGRACFDLSGHYPFHAWVELAEWVVNDHAELQSGYDILQRIPTT